MNDGYSIMGSESTQARYPSRAGVRLGSRFIGVAI